MLGWEGYKIMALTLNPAAGAELGTGEETPTSIGERRGASVDVAEYCRTQFALAAEQHNTSEAQCQVGALMKFLELSEP